ncbi:hypothetical protein EYF80_008368 [Liparis tanakae]|uniref:Uncharacterized protein n=1 Tax=Liparis tanakae TaxID=230148 RepID=A0A4Z2IUR8_9TELE|nr:hypothetical protein EYF80_008368 [Liparis tanakae]
MGSPAFSRCLGLRRMANSGMKATQTPPTVVVPVRSYHRGEGHVAAVDPGQSKVSQLHLALAGD